MAAQLMAACALAACSDAQEAKRVELPVVADGAGLVRVTTDLGYEVELHSASLVAEDLNFTIAGEEHSSLERFWDLVLPAAHAHPGHYQGGSVTGELPGHFIVRFVPGQSHELGIATLLVGEYHALDFTLARAAEGDVEETDALAGHTAVMSGTATLGDVSLDFEIALDAPEARDLVGIPFDAEITTKTRGPLALRMTPLDPLEEDTLFDAIDFVALDYDGNGIVRIDPRAMDEATVAAYNRVRRTFQTHDHFVLHLED
jgi:hypothetical protein